MVPGQFNLRLQPELCLAVSGYYMNMHAIFFSGKEEKPVPAFLENRWTHRIDLEPFHSSQRAAASSSLCRASTQASPSVVISFFQKGARVFR